MAIVGKSLFPLQNSIRNITGMKARFDQLQLQLATGKKASSLSEMGTDRFFDLSMRARLNKLESFGSSINSVNLRLDVLGSTMGRLDAIESSQRGLVTPGGYGSSGINLATAPEQSKARLDEVLNLLNTSIDGRYLFGGSTADRMPVEELQTVLEGGAGKAGFRTVLEERTLADRGTDGLGRLDLGTTTDTVTLGEDGAHPFGFKLAALRSTASGVTLAGPTGAPAGLSVQFTGVPAAGQSIEISLTLPDGTEELVRLTATDGAGGPGSFSISGPGTAMATAASVATAAGPLVVNGQSFSIASGDDATAIASLINSTQMVGVVASVGTGADAGKLILTGDTPLTDIDVTGTVGGLNLATGTYAAAASPEASAANFAAALEGTLVRLGQTSLAAASTFAAAENFFNGQGEPVLRVDGTPSFAQATALKAASAVDTVFWYKGGTQGIKAANLGRLTLGTDAGAATTTLGELGPVAAGYGFRIAGVQGALTGATSTLAGGSPESLSVAFTGAPASPVAGETLTVNLELPGGGTRNVTLRVASGAVAGPGEFAAGATDAATAANFEAALRTGLEAAAGQAAGRARETVRAQVDDGVNVKYGVQANENGMLELVRTLAAMSTTTYASNDATAPQRFDAMAERNLARLNEGHNNEPGSLEVIAVELGLAQATMGQIGDRHTAQKAQLDRMLGDLEGVSKEEVAMEILALKTRLEASYQTTSMIAQMSLVNYL
jgi:flagellar hook-associated protein 3 FlgL